MPEDDERYKDKKVINVIATTNKGVVTKVQRILMIVQIFGIWVGFVVV